MDGVHGLFIAPADLAASMGHRGNPGHPEVQAAIEGAMKTIIANGKAAGTLTSDPVLAQRYLDLGCTFVAVGWMFWCLPMPHASCAGGLPGPLQRQRPPRQAQSIERRTRPQPAI